VSKYNTPPAQVTLERRTMTMPQEVDVLEATSAPMSETVKSRLREVGKVLEDMRLNLANALASLRGSILEKGEERKGCGGDAISLANEIMFDARSCGNMAAELRDAIGD
jgi:hypothetical protein